jgi:two-component system OmpR family response regulator
MPPLRSELALGDARLVRKNRTLERGSDATLLTQLEFDLLWCLGEAGGRLLSRAEILAHVWNDRSGVPTRVVDAHVAALRKKLARSGAGCEISAVRGFGYRLDLP